MTLNLGVLGLREQKECIHGCEQQRPAFKLPFQLALPSAFVDQEHPRSAGSKQEGRLHICSIPNLLISRENGHRLVPNRGKSAGSEHCCRPGGQKNATLNIH